MNLYELIKKNNFQGFSVALIRRFAYALLQSLRMLHRERIIHCDLKPENILLRQKGQSSIKVIDFGSSCYEHQRGKYAWHIICGLFCAALWTFNLVLLISKWCI